MSNSKQVWTVLSMLEWATDYFKEKGVPSPRMSIEWILADVLQIKRLDIYLQYDRPLSTDNLNTIRPMIKRRAVHEPLQYITGYTDFMSERFKVTPDVLIPRPETEQLVEILINRYQSESTEELNLLDIGTGSGCIPVSIKKQNPAWICAGLDISADAVAIAKENAAANKTEVDIFEGDLFNLAEIPALYNRSWDIIISNPPYITELEKKEMEAQVVDYEPSVALFHESPASVYEKIAEFAAANNASLFLEINNRFSAEILDIISRFYKDAHLEEDLDGNKRFIIALRPA